MQIIDLVPDLRPTILAAREMRDRRNSLARFLPYASRFTLSYRLGRRKRLDQTAPVRAFGAPATPIRRPGLLDVRGDLPAITPIVNFNEVDLNNELILAQQLAGQPVDWQPALTSGAANAALTIDNTFELMRGQLLSTGIVSLIAEDGATHSVDFGIPAGQKITAGAVWNPASPAAVIASYVAGHKAYQDAAGDDAAIALMSTAARTVLLAAVQTLFPQQPIGLDQLNAYLANQNAPLPVTYDRKLEAANGTKTRVLPVGTVVYLPSDSDPVGRTEMGVTQEAVQQSQRNQPSGSPALSPAEVPGVTIVTLGNDDPVERAVKAAVVGLPVLADTDNIAILSGVVTE